MVALPSGRLFAKRQSELEGCYLRNGLRLISIKGSDKTEGAPLPPLLIDP